MEFDGFEWDAGNWPKCASHGVTRDEIEACIQSGRTRIFPDVAHSDAEDRLAAIGLSVLSGHWMIVHFTLRHRLVRPISARFMHRKEVAKYDQTKG